MKWNRMTTIALLLCATFIACDDGGDSNEVPMMQPQRDMSLGNPSVDAGGNQGVSDMGAPEVLDQGTNPIDTDSDVPSGEDMAVMPGGAQTPTFGDLLVTEFLYNPEVLSDETAEWIELTNVSSNVLTVSGCFLADGGTRETYQVEGSPLGDFVLAPNQQALFTSSNDPALNGGLSSDGLFDFRLSNDGDEIYVICDDIEIDVVRYDGGRTTPNAKGESIIRTVVDGEVRWCPAREVYDEATNQKGTPGEPNENCEALEAPACWGEIDCTVAEESCIDYVCALPPARCTVDSDCLEEAEFCDNGTCRIDETGCQSNIDCALGQMCMAGECVGMNDMPECSADQPCNEGFECTNGECVSTSTDECQTDVDCPNGTCESGVCMPVTVEGAVQPGDVVISEIMFNPDLPDDESEWIELANLTDQSLSLDGCILSDEQANHDTPLDGLVAPAMGGSTMLVLASSTDLTLNGGVTAAAEHNLDFRNSSGERISLTCLGTLIDTVTYDSETPPASSFQKSADQLSTPNDNTDHWCAATEQYLADPAHLGTPGSPNTICGPVTE